MEGGGGRGTSAGPTPAAAGNNLSQAPEHECVNLASSAASPRLAGPLSKPLPGPIKGVALICFRSLFSVLIGQPSRFFPTALSPVNQRCGRVPWEELRPPEKRSYVQQREGSHRPS